MIQTTSGATDEDVAAIHQIVEENGYTMNDKRDERTSGTYVAFVACVYAFSWNYYTGYCAEHREQHLHERIGPHQAVWVHAGGRYGWPPAFKMILAEAFTLCFLGCIVGCAIGLPFSKVIYDFLITDHFPYASWSLPVGSLAVIVLFVIAAAVLAAYSPAKRMRTISVTESINEL